MNFQANYPIYLQIAEDIKRRIVVGELKAGDKLPSNAELALAYQVNPNTVQRIYRQLEAEGISYTKRGIGTFLMENPEMPEQLRQEIGEKLSAQFLAQMATYHFSKEEIIHLLEAQAQWQETWSQWIDAKALLHLSVSQYLKAIGKLD